MSKKVRVGIMGGTFNPIHLGHVIAGNCALEQYHLDKVLFMPTKTPPHKPASEIADGIHRANMVERAIQENPQFVLSCLELEREGVTYTVDTLRALHQMQEDCEYYFIIGADSLFSFQTWKEPAEILKLATVLVASRYGLPREKLEGQIAILKKQYGGVIEVIEIPTIGISSSELRDKVRTKKSIQYLVDEKVRIYIQENGLYR